MKTLKYIIILLILTFTLSSCEDFNTELDNPFTEDPTPQQTVSEQTSKQIFKNWFNTVGAYNGPGLAFTTMADMNTCSWGNAGMRDTSSEPRIAWDNSSTYTNKDVTYKYFNSLYSILPDSNNLIKAINDGLELENPELTMCMARFGQAASIGYLALVFDKVWISDETGTLNNGEPVTPSEAIEFALTQLDKAIALAENNSFTVDSDYIYGQTYSSTQFAQYLNSFAARLIVNNARNSTQRDAIDWARVLNYANRGLEYDFLVTSDGWTNWKNEWTYYAVFPGWARIDMRIINMLDSNSTDYWTDPDGNEPPADSSDRRLDTDFQYLSSQDFIPSRGIYHYSNYRYKRYDGPLQGSGWTGAAPEFLKAENDLYKAEAYLRQGMLTEAAAEVNSSTRTTRGNLPAVAANEDDIAEAIHYERSIELLNTAMGLGFFEMRRENKLQAGTLLHFPIPGKTLESSGLPVYTFGGDQGVAGEDYSISGWR